MLLYSSITDSIYMYFCFSCCMCYLKLFAFAYLGIYSFRCMHLPMSMFFSQCTKWYAFALTPSSVSSLANSKTFNLQQRVLTLNSTTILPPSAVNTNTFESRSEISTHVYLITIHVSSTSDTQVPNPTQDRELKTLPSSTEGIIYGDVKGGQSNRIWQRFV